MQRTELRMDESRRVVADLYPVAILVFWERDDENEVRVVMGRAILLYSLLSPKTLRDWVRVRGCDGLKQERNPILSGFIK